MLPTFVRSFCTLIVVALLPSDVAVATPNDSLAARAVIEAESMPAGRERDVVLREISRNLRHVDRDQAIAAAKAMSEDYELRTFSGGPDKLTRRIITQQNDRSSRFRECKHFIERLKPGRADAADERRIRDCFAMDAPPSIVTPPLPPFELILWAADALPAGPTKAQLLYMATWKSVPDRPVAGASDAIRKLRALLPRLDGDTRREASAWLETTSVDLIEGRPDDAIARVRHSFARERASTGVFSFDLSLQAHGLIADFLKAQDFDRAIEVTNLLHPSSDCAMVDDGLTGVMQWVLPTIDGAAVAAYMAHLLTSGTWDRLCPKGLGSEIAADVWLKADDHAKALEAAERSGKPMVITKVQLAVIERRLDSGDTAGAMSLLQRATAEIVALNTNGQFATAAVARQRLRLIYLLARAGNVREAEQLASSYRGPGWRGFAYSVIVATTDRKRIGFDSGGPSLDLQEISVEH